MKKTYVYLCLLLFITLFSLTASANHYMGPKHHQMGHGNSPYLNGNPQKMNVSDLQPFHDDQYVILEGYIIRQLSGETFLFKDSTGEIHLDIDHKINYMLEGVDDKTLVQIYGEFDKSRFGPDEVEVKSLKIIKK